MKILSFVKSMLPHLTKNQVLDDLRNTAQELDEIAKPSFKAAADFFRTAKFKSDEVNKAQTLFYSKFDRHGASKQSSFVGEIQMRLQHLRENVDYIEDQIEAIFERDIFAEGLTAKKALLMRAAEHMSFISRMSLDVLNYIYTQEARAVGVDIETTVELSPAEIKHVELNMATFSSLLSDYGIPNKDFVKMFVSIPEIMVNSKSAAQVSQVFKETDLDPFQSHYAPGFIGNPIYHLRLIISEWQAARYRANKDKKRMLELRLLHLELLNEKKADPKIEQEMEYTRNRVIKIERYLREVEESVETAEA